MLKDTACGELREKDVGNRVTLAGWVHRRRDHGGLIFIDLRDRSGLVQVVFNPELSPGSYAVADEARSEWVLRVEGQVTRRPPEAENPGLPTGNVEVTAGEAEILNSCPTPPFYINEDSEVGREPATEVPLSGPSQAQDAGDPPPATQGGEVHKGLPGTQGVFWR